MNKQEFQTLIGDLEVDGYKPFINMHDYDMIAMSINCRSCNNPGLEYYGFRREGSYRAFVECNVCGLVEEF